MHKELANNKSKRQNECISNKVNFFEIIPSNNSFGGIFNVK